MADAKFPIPKLSGLNWVTWKIGVESWLCREDLWSVVVVDPPDEVDRTVVWKTGDRKAKATIIVTARQIRIIIIITKLSHQT